MFYPHYTSVDTGKGTRDYIHHSYVNVVACLNLVRSDTKIIDDKKILRARIYRFSKLFDGDMDTDELCRKLGISLNTFNMLAESIRDLKYTRTENTESGEKHD